MRRGPTMTLSFPPFTAAVKQLLIANGAVFLLVALLGAAFSAADINGWVNFHLGLVPALAVLHGWVWQFVTYSFVHAGLFHILFNLLALWMFGAQLEMTGAIACSCSSISSA